MWKILSKDSLLNELYYVLRGESVSMDTEKNDNE